MVSEAAALFGTIPPVDGGDPAPRYEHYGGQPQGNGPASAYSVAEPGRRPVSASTQRRPTSHRPQRTTTRGNSTTNARAPVPEIAPTLDLDFGESFAEGWGQATDTQWFDSITTGRQWPVPGPSTSRETQTYPIVRPAIIDTPVLDMDDQMQMDMEANERTSRPQRLNQIRRKSVPPRSTGHNLRRSPPHLSPRQRSQRPERRTSPSSRTPSVINSSQHRVRRPAARSPPRGNR